MVSAPGITVNGIHIDIEQINAEVQYHPAGNLQEAKYRAMEALVIRELLIQKAVHLGLCEREKVPEKTDDLIDKLLEQEISVPDPSPEECERYYKNNKKHFHTSALFEADHILYLAPPEDKEAVKVAREKAETALKKIKKDQSVFESIARAESACPSAKQGGSLGQLGKGQTVPAFEAALMKMQEGEISETPVETEVGLHIIRVHRRIDGRELPFEAVSKWVADHLREQSWRRAFSQYIQILAGQAKISGFKLKKAESPLVQ